MGQQQILFLILGVCVLGIAVSVGVIALQQEASHENRAILIAELQRLGTLAQEFYKRPFEDRGGGGSFLPLTGVSHSVSVLSPTPSKAHGDFFIKKTSSCTSVEIVAIGVVPGNDRILPVRAMITVYPESTAVSILN
jgi:hypothetical protein